jgi:hypothetical protein
VTTSPVSRWCLVSSITVTSAGLSFVMPLTKQELAYSTREHITQTLLLKLALLIAHFKYAIALTEDTDSTDNEQSVVLQRQSISVAVRLYYITCVSSLSTTTKEGPKSVNTLANTPLTSAAMKHMP